MTAEIVRAFALSWLLSHNYGAHSAAVLKYIQTESGFQPCIERRTGKYLFQWVGKRLEALHAAYGPGCPTLEQQMTFADREIRTLFPCFLKVKPKLAEQTFHNTFGRGPICSAPRRDHDAHR